MLLLKERLLVTAEYFGTLTKISKELNQKYEKNNFFNTHLGCFGVLITILMALMTRIHNLQE